MEKVNKVLILNATFGDSQHEMIDSSLIIAFSKFTKNIHVYFLKDRIPIIKKIVDNRVGNNTIKYHSLFNASKKTRITFRELIASIQECWVFLSKADKETITCVTYINRFNGYALNYLSKITGKKLLMCCHGELQLVATEKTQNEINWVKMMRNFYVNSLIARNARLIVLGDSIKKNLSKYVSPAKADSFVVFDHPYFCNKQIVHKHIHDTISIGVIGFLNKEKERGFDNVIKLSRVLIDYPNYTIQLLGNVENSLLNELPSNVVVRNKSSRFISREKYDSMIDELDYIYCPYPKGAFKFSASGALLDAISKGKPIIMHGNDYANYLRTKFGDFGLLLDENNLGELSSILSDSSLYNELLLKQKKVLEKISPERLSSSLLSIINNI